MDQTNITPTEEALKPFGGPSTLQQDPWFGSEPDAPPELPPDPVTLVPPAPIEVAPEAEVAPEEVAPEGEEVAPVEALADPNAPVVTTEEPKKTKGFPWSELKELRSARAKLEQEQAVAVAQATERQRQLDEIRASQQEYQRRIQEQADREQRAQNPGTPGVDRPYTAAEVAQLKQEDPILHAQLMSEWAVQQAQAQAQQMQMMQMQNLVRDQIDSFKRTKPDYEDSLKWLEEREMKRATAMGMDTQRATAYVQERAGLLVQTALQQGKNVGALAYEVALADGWTTPTAAPVAIAAPVAPAQPSAVDQIRANQARVQAERGSLGNVTGGNPPRRATITRAQFMQLNPAQIERLEMENKCDIDDLLVG
jgi:hypothetical protein